MTKSILRVALAAVCACALSLGCSSGDDSTQGNNAGTNGADNDNGGQNGGDNGGMATPTPAPTRMPPRPTPQPSPEPREPVCGDGECNGEETTATCQTDCGSRCGDETCNGDENSVSCAVDCGSACGDGACNGEEGTASCPDDCGALCGDDVCNGGESSTSCAEDCGSACGDSACNGEETTITCAADCGSQCNDGVCNGDETSAGCPDDCGSECGNDVCIDGETAQSCPADCPAECGDGACTHAEGTEDCPGDCGSRCGDDTCNGEESTATCPGDCGSECGDGVCNDDETTASCHDDCGSECGDEACNGDESSVSCVVDCGSECGDAVCNGDEDSASCSQDCGDGDDCPDELFLDVASAPGAGAGHPAPTLSVSCDEDTMTVQSNGIPHYNFIRTTPNELIAQNLEWVIPKTPQMAAETSALPLLGVAGFAVNGLPFFGPNEAAQPADEAFGDPIFNGLMDNCLGHTATVYHYHAFSQRCLVPSSLVATPWTNADPSPNEPSPVLGFALDGYPIHGPYACADAACDEVIEMRSSYVQISDPTMNAWDAYEFQRQVGPTFLDECNGRLGPDGQYRYHATSTFPYILGCYRGVTSGTMPGGGNGGGNNGQNDNGQNNGGQNNGGNQGPQSCTGDGDCTNACSDDAAGCICAQSPMGRICVPSCSSDADCPSGPDGRSMTCNGMGFCVRQGRP